MSEQDSGKLRRLVGILCAEHRSIKSTNVTEVNGVIVVRVTLKWWSQWMRGWMLNHFYDELTPYLPEPVILEVI